MTIAINYGTATNGRTYFADWRADFISGNHPDNTGGFYPGSLSGTQYALSSGVDGHTAGFIAGGSLNYTLFSPPAHTLYGQLDSLGFGDQIVKGGSGYGFNTGPELSITGLNLTGTQTANNIVHKVVYGLMQGTTTELEAVLNANNLSINGSSGADTVTGYNGNDTLTGGAGVDNFFFGVNGAATSFGNDTVTDYASGEKIQISNSLFANYSAFTAAGGTVGSVGGNTVIDTNGHGTITLTGVTSFSTSDLQFVA